MPKSMLKTFLRVFVVFIGLIPMNWLSPTSLVQAAANPEVRLEKPIDTQLLVQAELPALVSITFDDEDISVYENGFPILQAQQIPGTF